jgi:hypothetical protein
LNDQFYEDHGVDKDQLWFPADSGTWLVDGADIHVGSPYGLLRSPWNWNPDTFVTRFNAINGIRNISYMSNQISEPYAGVDCGDLEAFMQDRVNGQPLYNFLHYAEDQIHGGIHFTFGGAGGDYAYEMNAVLKSQYGIDDEELILLAQAAQTFVKRFYPTYLEADHETVFEGLNNGDEFPFTCTSMPWNSTSQTLWTTDEPGQPNAICTFNSDYYCASADRLSDFYSLYLGSQTTSVGVRSPFSTTTLQLRVIFLVGLI